jgi:hypothetical protein
MFKWIKRLLNADTTSVSESVQVTSPQSEAALTAIEVAVTAEPAVKKPRTKKPAAAAGTNRTAKATPPKQAKKLQ